MRKRLLISEKEIHEAIFEIASKFNTAGEKLHILIVLKGAICFAADLMRELTVPFEIDFLSASSYGMRGTVPGELSIGGVEKLNLKGENVLLLDDIYDTGKTISALYREIDGQNPKKLSTLVLLRKKVQAQGNIEPDHVCFEIDDDFVIGYGLDYKEEWRGLRDIFAIEE